MLKSHPKIFQNFQQHYFFGKLLEHTMVLGHLISKIPVIRRKSKALTRRLAHTKTSKHLSMPSQI